MTCYHGDTQKEIYTTLIDNKLISLELYLKNALYFSLIPVEFQGTISLVLRPFQCTEERKGLVNNHTLARICGILKLHCDWSTIVPNFIASVFYRAFKIQQTMKNDDITVKCFLYINWHSSLSNTDSRNAAIDLC